MSNCVKANICVVESSNSSSVMPSVHMHSFESISVTEVIIYLQNHADCSHVCARVLSMHTPTQLVALKNCKWGFAFIPPCHWQMEKSKHFSAFIKGGRNYFGAHTRPVT